jgi:apolipoprotein N-acyltransferase
LVSNLLVAKYGISTVVLASGEILQQSPMQEAWSGLYEVPYLKEPKATYYQQNFWLMPSLLGGLLLFLLLCAIP